VCYANSQFTVYTEAAQMTRLEIRHHKSTFPVHIHMPM